MITTKSNSYTMSRDFPDHVPRMLAREIQDRLRIAPDAMPAVIAIAATELAPDDKLVVCDGQAWLTELQVYGAIEALKRRGPQGRLRRFASSVLCECIKAFVDERREPPQKPKLVGGEETYECETPGTSDMFRTMPDGGYDLDEVGSTWFMLEALAAGDIPFSPSEALHRTIECFDAVHAKRQRVAAWSPIAGNSPRNLA